jgi:hypothetical protein
MPFGPKNLVELDTDLSTLRKIPGSPGYYVNESGEVFSIRRLSPHRDEDGYERVNSGKFRAAVHQILAKVFLPSPAEGQNEVRHLDGNPKNNSIANLAWGTRQQNASDMATHGTAKGSKNARAILSESDVLEIKKMLRERVRQHIIATSFGVSKSTIKAIQEGRNWSHVKHD